jgi:phosphotransferase system HPr (HPr) family protein
MREGTLRVVNPLGLHARAAAQLVRLARGFKSRMLLKREDTNAIADAKSILSLLSLAASIGTALFLHVEGEDEETAFDAVSRLFSDGFGEI